MTTPRPPSAFGETFRTIAYAVVVALVVRTFAFEPFNIPSGSMVPTLLVGDYLFVSKLSYGYSRHSLPLSPPLFGGRVFFTEPERGDVAVFKLPSKPSEDYIKRVIGLPGDRIQVRTGRLYINDQPVERKRLDDYLYEEPGGRTVRMTQYLETLPGGREHRILERTDMGPYDDTRVFTVPQGHYFMMGDNRDNSVDSRASVGFVPMENLVGRAEALFFSTDGSGAWWQLWRWPSMVRFERLFSGIS